MDEEKKIVKVERQFVGRRPYYYDLKPQTTTLELDSGFGRAGARLDPKTGALMHDMYQDRIHEEQIKKPPVPKPVVTGVRFSSDSRAIINIKEEEEVHISSEGDIRGHSVNGIISVKNISDKDRIWDVAVNFKDTMGLATVDYDRIEATEIEPNSKASKPYKIDIERPSIILDEIISTHPDYPMSVIAQKGSITKAGFQLKAKNFGTISYKNVIVIKSLPPSLKDVTVSEDARADTVIEDGKLVWKINLLEKGASKTLDFEGILESQERDEIPAGDIRLEARGMDTLSSFVITDFDAMCRNMYYIDVDETENPGEWLCTFICDNTSSFEVEILRVQVQDPVTGNFYVNVEKSGIRVPPGKQWNSNSWNVRSDERPAFIKNMILNVIPGIEKEVHYRLNKIGSNLHFGGINFTKTFDKNQVVAKRITDVGTRLEIENTGSAIIDQLFIRDHIPRHMMPPSPSTIRIMRGPMELKDNFRVMVEPEDQGPDAEQTLIIHINDISNFGGPLDKGEKITVTYSAPVIRPEASMKLNAPAEVDAKSDLPGPVIPGRDLAGAPSLDTTVILRKFSIGKSIVQGTNIGEYHIGLLYKNRGNIPINNLIIKDNIPRNFSGMGYTIEPRTSTNAEGSTQLFWTIPEVKEGETIGITYVIKGQGKYHPSDAQVFYNSIDD